MGANLSLFVTGFAVRAGASTHHTHPTMPKSRRVKSTALTNTVSKGRELKTELIDSIRQAIDKYEHLYVISFENMCQTCSKVCVLR